MYVQHHAAALRRLVLDRLAVLDAGGVGPRLVEHDLTGGAVDRDEQSGHPCLGITRIPDASSRLRVSMSSSSPGRKARLPRCLIPR